MVKENKLLEKVIKEFDLYKGQKINEEFLKKMYNQYGNDMTMIQFANMLGIKDKTYNSFENKIRKSKQENNGKNVTVIILSNRNINNEQKSIEILKLIKKYNLYKDKKIDYEFFRQMYNDVKTFFTEVEFANAIGISDSNLRNCRTENQKVKIFKNMTLEEERIEQIRQYLIRKYEGKKIYYEDKNINNGEVSFLEIYELYKIYFSKKELAELLGISEKNLWYTKNGKANPRIKDSKKVEAVKVLKDTIKECRYYTKDELQQMCESVNISLKDFINYYINKGNFFDSSVYEELIENKQVLWIGKAKIENEDFEKNIEILKKIVNTVVNDVQKRFRQYYLEDDLKSSIMFYIVSECGDLYYNFKHDMKLMERMIWLRTRKFATIIYNEEYKKNIKNIKLDEGKTKSKSNLPELEIIKIKPEEINLEEKMIQIFQDYLEQGYDRDLILQNLSNIFSIGSDEILQIIRQYLLNNGIVVKNKKGEYEIGEK